MLLDYINKVVQIWLLATTGISAITTTIIMIEYSFVIVTDLKKKIKKQEVQKQMKNFDLTIRETELLEYIIKFKQTNGFSPTIREMAKGINTKSLNHINNMIYSLQDKGYISLKEKRPRTIVIKKFIQEGLPMIEINRINKAKADIKN